MRTLAKDTGSAHKSPFLQTDLHVPVGEKDNQFVLCPLVISLVVALDQINEFALQILALTLMLVPSEAIVL